MRHKAGLGPRAKALLYSVSAVLWLSGAAWLLAPAPFWLKAHGAAAMAFAAVFGALLADHIPVGWAQGRHRPSGAGAAAACGVLILTGWALYYCGEPARDWASRVHWTLGLALPALLALHVWR